MATSRPKKLETAQAFGEIPENVDPNMLITVRNGYHGTLTYTSPRTHEEFVWDDFGDEQDMELKELRTAKSTKKAFFENNYFMFDEEYSWVIPYLDVAKYYVNAMGMDGFEKIFHSRPDEIKRVIKSMSKGQKKSLAYCAKDKIASGEVDSMRVISAIEDGLGVTLLER